MLEPLHIYKPLVYKAHWSHFNKKTIEICEKILNTTPNGGKLWLEDGEARSSVKNLKNQPHMQEEFKEFFKWQAALAKEVTFDKFNYYAGINYCIDCSWVNVHGMNGKTLAHSHGLNPLAISAYIYMPEGGGCIEFKDPHFDIKSRHEMDLRFYNSTEWVEVPIVTGDVLFFPGWLQHRTQPNKSIENRWVLSSNYANISFRRSDLESNN